MFVGLDYHAFVGAGVRALCRRWGGVLAELQPDTNDWLVVVGAVRQQCGAEVKRASGNRIVLRGS